MAAAPTTTKLTIIVSYLAEKLLLGRVVSGASSKVVAWQFQMKWNEIELVAHIKQRPRLPLGLPSPGPFLTLCVLNLLTSSTFIVVYGLLENFNALLSQLALTVNTCA